MSLWFARALCAEFFVRSYTYLRIKYICICILEYSYVDIFGVCSRPVRRVLFFDIFGVCSRPVRRVFLCAHICICFCVCFARAPCAEFFMCSYICLFLCLLCSRPVRRDFWCVCMHLSLSLYMATYKTLPS